MPANEGKQAGEATRRRSEEISPPGQEGWPRHQEMSRSIREERTGWWIHYQRNSLLELEPQFLYCGALSGLRASPARLCQLRWLRNIFFVAQPPLLSRRGNFLASTFRRTKPTQALFFPVPALGTLLAAVFCQASVIALPSVSSSTLFNRTFVDPARPQAPASGANVLGFSRTNSCC